MTFRYKARDRSGALREGKLEASGRAEALAILQQMELFVVDLKASGGPGLNLTTEIQLGGPRKVSSRDLAVFCGQFSSLLSAGVPVLQGLSVLSRQFKKSPLSRVLEGVIHSIQGGASISQAMREFAGQLPPALIYITSVAEVSGNLDTSYALLAAHFEQEDSFLRKVRSAFTYPIVVLSVALLVIMFMVTVVLPTYGKLFTQMGAELPDSTQFLMALGQGIRRYWYLLPWPVLGLVWGLRSLLRRPPVRAGWQRFLMRVPIFGSLVYRRELARLCRTLGTMTRSGVPLLAALLTAREAMDHRPLQEALDAIQEDVRRGDTFGQALERQPIFDRISVEIISLGEAAGNLDAMLFRVADLAEKDVNTLVDRLTQLMEPALTVTLGAIVVSIILPMLLPMFDIISKVR
ncbi:MAG: type II secretion system F family protein [Bacillota bacterium]